ncbi:YoaK family protein [Sporocytophaga myxococcoides]|uniref:YoaK family protein n=1 Tax=Sporocytophaga myxococcoides TaxID=153721 RepID=UPI0004189AE3|nr:YoaK family protein [Sporocytophaga myxococcoides]
MFIHHGRERTFKHNLQIASLLSFVAGIVNVAGFLSVAKLTTNITGHFAFFIDEAFKLNTIQTILYFVFIVAFFSGSFASGLLIEIFSRKSAKFVFIVPIILESIILTSAGLLSKNFIDNNANLIATLLLFTMGLQNSLVTKISNATVRTTHLTGLFTDLGIELSQLFFYSEIDQKQKLYRSIKLRFTIISFFFLGGLFAGILYDFIQIKVLLLGSIVLIAGIIYTFKKQHITESPKLMKQDIKN